MSTQEKDRLLEYLESEVMEYLYSAKFFKARKLLDQAHDFGIDVSSLEAEYTAWCPNETQYEHC